MKKIKFLTLLLLIFFNQIKAQESSEKSVSYINFNIGSFINLGNSINSKQTNKIFEEFNTPGVQAGLSYEIERKKFLLSGGLNIRIVPYGYKGIIQLNDLQPKNERFPYFFANSRYVYYLPSLPFKFTYQTKTNLAQQRFWFSIGTELNFSNFKEDDFSVSYNSTNSSQPVELLVFNTSIQKQTFLAVNFGTGITKIQKNGDQIRFGLNLNANYVGSALIKGDYLVNLKNETINGTYSSNGSNFGLSIAYALKQDKK